MSKPDDDAGELAIVAFLVFVAAPFALVKLCGGSWGVFAAGWGVLLLAVGLAWLGRWVRRWVQGWRTDRVLRREDAEFATVSAVGNESNSSTDETPSQLDERCDPR